MKRFKKAFIAGALGTGFIAACFALAGGMIYGITTHPVITLVSVILTLISVASFVIYKCMD